MAYTQPVLGGTNLAHPQAEDGYTEEVYYRGGSLEAADGTINFDLNNTNVKRDFILRWSWLTDSEKADILTAFATVKTASASFTAPTGSAYTVTRSPSQEPIRFTYRITAGGTSRWSGELRLREV